MEPRKVCGITNPDDSKVMSTAPLRKLAKLPVRTEDRLNFWIAPNNGLTRSNASIQARGLETVRHTLPCHDACNVSVVS